MSTEISHTPIPATVTLTPERSSDPEQIELICRECDLNIQVEGSDLILVTEALDDAHAVRHPVGAQGQEATP